MNLNKKDMKNLMLLILFAVVVYVGIQRADVLLVFARFMVGIAYPFLLGAAFAFVLNVPMSFLEKRLFGSAESKGKMKKLGRPLSLILSLILVVGSSACSHPCGCTGNGSDLYECECQHRSSHTEASDLGCGNLPQQQTDC